MNNKNARGLEQPTEHSSDESKRELRSEQGEEPRGSVERWSDLVDFEMIVQIFVHVVDQTG